jgi:hypothetical protein
MRSSRSRYHPPIVRDNHLAPGPSARVLLRSLGGPRATATIDAYCRRGPAAIARLFAALLAPPELPADRNGRAVFEDEESCLVGLARAHPQVFLAALDKYPALAERLTMLGPIAEIPGPASEQLLLAALAHRSGAQRWRALHGLLARDSELLTSRRLIPLLRDRDSTVAFTALDGLRRRGRVDAVPALLRYIETAAIGGVEFARDAIEAICAREGQPLPKEHPGARLEIVTASGKDIELAVIVASRVKPGERLARVDGVPLCSPCAGVVAAIDLTPCLCLAIRRDPDLTR